jgi:uncharacterized protein (DUF924 family)
MSRVDEILEFWFNSPEHDNYGKQRKEWFTKKTQFDEQVRSRFLSDYELAAAGKLDDWKSLPPTCLALIILLDQFPRNMFRGEARSFATDAQALAAAQHAVQMQFDRQLPIVQRWFIYLPFEHSEDINMQRQSVALWQQLSEYPECADTITYAIRHLEIIERFGRFPHRNKILGRKTTPEEEEFLKQPGSSF